MAKAGVSKKLLLDTFNQVKLRQLNELRKENEFCDLILKSEDGFEIKVHKNVVSSASNYFKDLLTLPMKEKHQESILLPNITADVLEKIVTFIYTSEFEEGIEDVEKIVKYAAIFQLEQLVEICSLALSESITDQSCLKYWRLAKTNLIHSLEDKCLAYIVIKADYLFKNSLISDLTIEEMRSLLADNRLHLECVEKYIFEHVWKWAESRISETESFSQIFSEVADLFNYAELEQEFILQRIFFNDDLTENAEIFTKIAKLTKKKYEAVSRSFFFYKPTQRLLGLAQNKMFIGLGEEGTIEKVIDLRSDFSYTKFHNKLLMCGGWGSTCELFNTKEWKKFSSMNSERGGHRCAYLDNKIYVCGGYYSKSVEIFDLSKGGWEYGPRMLDKKRNFGLAGVNGALYAIGGFTNKVQMLDPRTQNWDVCCSFNEGMLKFEMLSCVSIGPYIYSFNSEKRFIFDTRLNNYIENIRLKDRHFCCNYCALEGYIYGFGYQKDSAGEYSLNLVQYHLDGKQGLKKSYGLYNEMKTTGIVSLYY